jgi:TonB family protein
VRRSFLVSSAVHLVFLVMVISPGFDGARRHLVEVMNVRLVGEQRRSQPKPEEVKPPEPQPQPEKKTEKSKMAYKTTTKTRETNKEVKPVEQKPKPAEPEKEKPPPPVTKGPESDQPESPAASTSSVRVDDEDFRFAYYLEIIKERVSFNWSPPPVSGRDNLICTVYFRVLRDGRISRVKVEQASGFSLFDKSALRAVERSGPLPPLPAGFEGGWLGVHFEFQQTSG